MVWTVYILECKDKTLYTGITNDLESRLEKHDKGAGAKYTRGRGPFAIVFTERHPTKSSALKREAGIKALSPPAKRALGKRAFA